MPGRRARAAARPVIRAGPPVANMIATRARSAAAVTVTIAVLALAVTTNYVVITGTVAVRIPGLAMCIAVLAVRYVVIGRVVTRQRRSVVMT